MYLTLSSLQDHLGCCLNAGSQVLQDIHWASGTGLGLLSFTGTQNESPI